MPDYFRPGAPWLLDLFCGEGGAGMGYWRAGFNVLGVDSDPARLRRYPFRSVCTDALAFVLAWGHDFAAIHASPPCTAYTRGTTWMPDADRLARYGRLIGATREALRLTGRPYVIENVEDAKGELDTPLTLCWTEFRKPGSVLDVDGTPLWMRRHRLFESNVWLWGAGSCAHPATMQCAGAYGSGQTNRDYSKTVGVGYTPGADIVRRLIGAPWMTLRGCQLSIPPAYTQHIGEQLMDWLTRWEAA